MTGSMTDRTQQVLHNLTKASMDVKKSCNLIGGDHFQL